MHDMLLINQSVVSSNDDRAGRGKWGAHFTGQTFPLANVYVQTLWSFFFWNLISCAINNIIWPFVFWYLSCYDIINLLQTRFFCGPDLMLSAIFFWLFCYLPSPPCTSGIALLAIPSISCNFQRSHPCCRLNTLEPPWKWLLLRCNRAGRKDYYSDNITLWLGVSGAPE